MPCSRPLRLGVLLSVAVLFGFASVADAQTTRTVTRSLSLARDGHVELDTFTGRIDVTGDRQDQVTVEARIKGDDPELVDKTRLRFEGSEAHRTLKVDYDEVEDRQEFLGLFTIGDVDRPSVHLTIKMPRGAALTIDDFSSDVSVQGLRADVALETFSSSIDLRNVEGTMALETFSGDVDGKELRGQFQLETFSGEVRLQVAALTGTSQFETFSGDIELVLPADAGFELAGKEEAFGDLDSAFALGGEDGRWIAGDGGPRIEIETFSGTLRLRKH